MIIHIESFIDLLIHRKRLSIILLYYITSFEVFWGFKINKNLK